MVDGIYFVSVLSDDVLGIFNRSMYDKKRPITAPLNELGIYKIDDQKFGERGKVILTSIR